MNIVIEGLSTLVSLLLGGLAGYVIAYVTGLRAVRKGMQLILRASLNDMYIRFQNAAPTPEEKLIWQEMYSVYEHLAENGIMKAKHEAVLKMPEIRR
ncbi:MAG: FAM49 family protein [Clostridiales bacterium]|nr:FAM49 family protein [Clostridiales bacterium]